MPEISFDTAQLDTRSVEEILARPAVEFVAELHRRFNPRRLELLCARAERQAAIAAGGTLDFLEATRAIREDSSWQVAPPREDYRDRRVEITGPTDRKMVINALNSGAGGFMADFEDANSPTWANQIGGQANLIDAIDRTITYDGADGRHYELDEKVATLVPRPRGWHLPERHLRVDGEVTAGALVDFGLYAHHCARRLVEKGEGVYLYLPKMEHHLEARLWEEIFTFTEGELGFERGSFRGTVLIETIPAAFQMEEILYELRDHSYGLNAGRWDYIFSTIKTFRDRPEFLLPDRAEVKMTVPFMRAYTELLVRTCHSRGAFAMGGMAALIPSRRDAEANARAVEAVRADKEREAGDGFDGTWVAHPDVVPVAKAAFDAVLGGRPNQIDRRRDDVAVDAERLLAVDETPGEVTEVGLRSNLSVGFQYISFWLGGRGAAAIDNLMEDAATAEICRAQIWQWMRHGAKLDDGRTITEELVRRLLAEEMQLIEEAVGEETWRAGRPQRSLEVLEAVALTEGFPDFLTLVAYDLLEGETVG
ncbi:MAG TPA: malate synthase A [Solirubrobacterales bacterium]|jgi:malate synthase|nr:malate synthase A [Solirubrobacterales bacterium]